VKLPVIYKLEFDCPFGEDRIYSLRLPESSARLLFASDCQDPAMGCA
jgi:hypothetical protein